jgi:hypothetical protein
MGISEDKYIAIAAADCNARKLYVTQTPAWAVEVSQCAVAGIQLAALTHSYIGPFGIQKEAGLQRYG